MVQNEKVYGNRHYLHYWAAQSKDKTPKPQFYRQWGLYTSPANPLEKRVKYGESIESAKSGEFARGKISTNGGFANIGNSSVGAVGTAIKGQENEKTPIKWGRNLIGGREMGLPPRGEV
jgi:hypothetical protein